MKKLQIYARLLACPLLVLMSAPSRAEYGCQEGFIPVNKAGRQVCVADYNLPSWRHNSPNTQGSPASARRWQTTWGAVVIDDPKGIIGVSEGKMSDADAVAEAMNACARDGGLTCELVTKYHNQCVAIAWPKSLGTNSVTGTAKSKARAENLSMKRCRSLGRGVECSVVYSACTDSILL